MTETKPTAHTARRDQIIRTLTESAERAGVHVRDAWDVAIWLYQIHRQQQRVTKPRGPGRPPSFTKGADTSLYVEISRELFNQKYGTASYQPPFAPTSKELDQACAVVAKNDRWIKLARPQGGGRGRSVAAILKDRFVRYRGTQISEKPTIDLFADVIVDDSGEPVLNKDGDFTLSDSGKFEGLPSPLTLRKRRRKK
jgi:hypothetical protein